MTEQQERIGKAIKELVSASGICKVEVILVPRHGCGGGEEFSQVHYSDGLVRLKIAEPITKEHYDEVSEVLADALNVLNDAEEEIIHDCKNPNWWKALCAKNRNGKL